ncbi:MAG: hypothetical protein A3C02_04480 [Candidatus Andersenbacteria bacterium RIFCSPHIGHO2_02_FULL_45_11]|uniref:Helix-turn-helix domain-containing protein n=1 Tax=Candidatus Andersenbacteria bacterium RIFCSPHIGHO2_12_FULL_45_11 TaxID=1797281 RepID=A0A1G1X2Z5_9BACT|nr:MAG: hypothetical protein A2805_02840 [Candidatus Andersenbacteria bacterium RIFCSPHIGHO2_01_FULL_46_36]OGY32166.1 MAG: hypothetical protein A3C02_04480 [Candidatus Andersenbacteria bacterium RIFCSPHIGHO2_02_FULL_45_11]OGY34314.1 MAG: hypothetical protein A3D99_04580 [Candidatus Andersenbacteria bacterium RIFCSPHIGHO2_12_FULL_45_11]
MLSMKTQEFYLVEEIAEKLRLSKMTIYRYMKAGRLHAHKVGKEYRIASADFKHFLQATKK